MNRVPAEDPHGIYQVLGGFLKRGQTLKMSSAANLEWHLRV